jgi:hypothetical protein
MYFFPAASRTADDFSRLLTSHVIDTGVSLLKSFVDFISQLKIPFLYKNPLEESYDF